MSRALRYVRQAMKQRELNIMFGKIKIEVTTSDEPVVKFPVEIKKTKKRNDGYGRPLRRDDHGR